jgi:hypothetical protein
MLNKSAVAVALSVALALGVASSASAGALSFDEAEYGYTAHYGNTANAGYDAYAQAGPYDTVVSSPVTVQRRIVGHDPDVNVRAQEQRDREYINY